MLSFQGGLFVPAYTASKHGIAGLTKALANEWAKERINVNAIAPGYIATENTRPLREDPKRNQAILDRIPEGRWGEPADIAGGCLFLASPDSDYLNGTILTIDGGWQAR
jgi:2-deoxy-D-gluconate 3-dehydrogenase